MDASQEVEEYATASIEGEMGTDWACGTCGCTVPHEDVVMVAISDSIDEARCKDHG